VSVSVVALAEDLEGVVLESAALTVTIIPAIGADIHSIVDRRTGIDVLFKTPWGVRARGRQPPASDSLTAWVNGYGGGWQVLLPSGGGPCVHAGVEHVYHGEAASTAWTWTAVGDSAVQLEVRLCHTPLRITRLVTLEEEGVLRILETVTNEGGEAVDWMWVHHPAFGEPLVGPDTRLDVPAGWAEADAADMGPFNPLVPGRRTTWPQAEVAGGGEVDLRRLPSEGGPRQLLAYLGDLREGRFTVANPAVDLCVTLRWDLRVFPYLWLWQELAASSGYPWYRSVRAIALEPASSMPADGLAAAAARGAQRVLEPGSSDTTELAFETHP
jgi:galactose mutarotase-like enzyme